MFTFTLFAVLAEASSGSSLPSLEDVKTTVIGIIAAALLEAARRWWKERNVTKTLVAGVDTVKDHAHAILKQYPAIVAAAKASGLDLEDVADKIANRVEDGIKDLATTAKLESTLGPVVDKFKTDQQRAAVDEHGNPVKPTPPPLTGGTPP